MEIVSIILFFILGLTFGSFFNVVGLRLPLKQPFTNDRSFCPSCHHTLAWYELVPVLSFVMQLCKCRHCKTTISPIYPIGELATGILFAISYMKIGFDGELITALLLVSMLMIIFVADIRYMLIPNKILLFFLPLFIVMRVLQPLDSWLSSILGAIAGLVITAIIILVSRGGMGAGDMKLFGVLGIILGLQGIILVFFLSTIIGAIVGSILLLFKLINRKQPIPFGPYIVVAAFITYFWGDSLIAWYIKFYV